MTATVSRSESGKIFFEVADVDVADRPLSSVKTKEAVEHLLGTRVEACSDYSDDCVAFVSTNPIVTAAKLAYDQHRPIEFSPESIWITLLQGLSQHIDEHWSVYSPKLVHDESKGEQWVSVSTEEFPVGSLESPWNELVAEAAQQALAWVTPQFGSLYRMQFSNSSVAGNCAANIAFLSAVNRMMTIYDESVICGIPRVILSGAPDDWQRMGAAIEQFDDFGLDWWTKRLRPIINQFVDAACDRVDTTFWQRMTTVYAPYCRPTEEISGWIADLFPYTLAGPGKMVINPRIAAGDDTPLPLDIFPPGQCQVGMKSKRGSVVSMIGGFLGISQDTESMTLMPKVGWAVQRMSFFESLVTRLMESSHCVFELRETSDRPSAGQSDKETNQLRQRFRDLKIINDDGGSIFELITNEEGFGPGHQLSDQPLAPLARINSQQYVCRFDSLDFTSKDFAFVRIEPNAQTADVVGPSVSDILEAAINCAERGDSKCILETHGSFVLGSKQGEELLGWKISRDE